ncbi:MAG: hypothetical protein ACM3PY_05565 [Omnitrophica WOR_2 bacterium]
MKNQKTIRATQRKRQKQLKSLSMMSVGGLLLILLAVFMIKANQPEPKAAIEVKGSPSLKVDRENVDLGKVRLGNTVDVAFTLTNVGDQPLTLAELPYIEVVEGC